MIANCRAADSRAQMRRPETLEGGILQNLTVASQGFIVVLKEGTCSGKNEKDTAWGEDLATICAPNHFFFGYKINTCSL